MPIYEYKCKGCNTKKDYIQKHSDEPKVKCEVCNEDKLEKQVTSAAFGFRGTGYYCTDFKNKK